jgi:hypothetical protein
MRISPVARPAGAVIVTEATVDELSADDDDAT